MKKITTIIATIAIVVTSHAAFAFTSDEAVEAATAECRPSFPKAKRDVNQLEGLLDCVSSSSYSAEFSPKQQMILAHEYSLLSSVRAGRMTITELHAETNGYVGQLNREEQMNAQQVAATRSIANELSWLPLRQQLMRTYARGANMGGYQPRLYTGFGR